MDPQQSESDPVNHPSHYRSDPSGYECIEITRVLPYDIGNAVKYVWRYRLKGHPLEDLRKSQWFLTDSLRSFTDGFNEIDFFEIVGELTGGLSWGDSRHSVRNVSEWRAAVREVGRFHDDSGHPLEYAFFDRLENGDVAGMLRVVNAMIASEGSDQ